jgi:CDP-4-dehydro-6-deoxyglucose reductase
MPATVRILPSGRDFLVESHETVLEAGLRSGLALKYRCTNGTCGECKARVVSGQAREARFHDYQLNGAEKAAGMVLMCCTEAVSDLELEVSEIGGFEEIPYQEIQAKVSKLQRLARDIVVMHVRTPRSKSLEFLPGQYVGLTLRGLLPRFCSVASCPCNGSRLEFHVRHVPGDAFSEYVYTRLKASEEVLVAGPEGRLSFDKDSRRPVVFFAYDTGFAPIKSLIEYAFSLEGEQPMHLYWMALSQDQHYLDNLCRSWSDALDNFRYSPLTSRVAEPNKTGGQPWDELAAVQRVTADHPDLSGHDVYIAGPQGVVSAAQRHFMARGLPDSRLFAETVKYF